MATDMTVSAKPMTKYGMSFPDTISIGLTGVDMSCSMVPLSHSLATASEMSREMMTDMMMAMSPGMRKFLDFSSGLYQTLLLISMRGLIRALPWRREKPCRRCPIYTPGLWWPYSTRSRL